MKIKKLLFINMLFVILPVCAHAQMIDLIGSMGVGGAMDASATRSVGMANRKLSTTQLQSAIHMQMADILTAYTGDYNRMSKRTVTTGGHKVVFQPTDQGRAVEAKIENVGEKECAALLRTNWEAATKIRVQSARGSKDVAVNQASAKASQICKDSKSVSVIFQ